MGRRGMTLIELMVSFSVASLLCLFVLNLFPGSLIALRHSETRLEAQRVAEMNLDALQVLPFSTYPRGTTQSLPPATVNGNLYRITLQVAAVSGYSSSELLKLLVTVNWKERNGVSFELTEVRWITRGS